jgi:ketosteroid isomerase-like protein
MNSKRKAANRGSWMERFFRAALFLALSLALATTAVAQKKKKKTTDDSQPTPPASVVTSIPDEQKIDNTIGEWLGAWQVGDIEKLHKSTADDVTVVAGTWTPPAIGWTSYLAAYQTQRARMQQVRLDRSNTLIRVAPGGLFAWACYQWEFSAVVDGSPMAADGQTTLILEKQNAVWMIVHNHTSLVQASQSAAPASTAPPPAAPAPAKP